MLKRITVLTAALLLACLTALPGVASAAPAQDVSVEITSPAKISDVPVHSDNIEIRVTNNGRETYQNLSCYLTVVDRGRGQTYPADEFGENAYQTRTIDSLAPGESANVTIPVRILYVGSFRFTASVIDYATNRIFTGDAIDVAMTAASSLNKSLVMTVAALVPLALAAAAFFLTRGRTKKKE